MAPAIVGGPVLLVKRVGLRWVVRGIPEVQKSGIRFSQCRQGGRRKEPASGASPWMVLVDPDQLSAIR